MGLQILRERLRLDEQRLAIDGVAASPGFRMHLATLDAPMSAAAPHSAKTRPRLLMVDPPGSPDQLNQAYKLGAPMPSREVAKWTGQSPLVFRMRQTVRLFLSCRDTAIMASPQTTEGFDAKDGVGAGNVRRAWGGLFVRFCRVGDHSGAGP